jgi:hypothetical protein
MRSKAATKAVVGTQTRRSKREVGRLARQANRKQIPESKDAEGSSTMRLRRYLLACGAAVTLAAQDIPVTIDRAEIKRSVEEAMRAAEIDMKNATRAMELAVDHHALMADAKMAMAQAKEALAFDKGFAFNFNFNYQDGKARTPLTPDEEMKMVAIDAIMQNDTERGIPLVDKILQNQQASIRLRARALQALSRSNSPKAWDAVARVAKDGSNTELQERAVQLLGTREHAQNRQVLNEIYASTTNADIKRHILRSWASTGTKDAIVSAAKSDANSEVRESAIRHLGEMRATADLMSLYGSESNTRIRERILRAIANSDDWQKLLDIARTEKDEHLRARAVQHASSSRSAGAADALSALYGSTQDSATRLAVIRGLSEQRNAKQLIALARKETDPELKRQALQHLSRMKGEDVTAYLTELLSK